MTAAVDLTAVRRNVRALQAQAEPAALMAVVKADAYGHGAVPVARACMEEGVRHFAVARPAEGVALREAGLSGTVLVLGAPFPEQLAVYADHALDLTVSSEAVARAVVAAAHPGTPLRVHVKVDTGMHRLGLRPEAAPDVIRALADAPGVTLAGVWTHFATADVPGSRPAAQQHNRFAATLAALDVVPDRVHAANTGALLTLPPVADGPALVRSGIALYGLAADAALADRVDLTPAMTLTARVTHLQTVEAGASVSYGGTWTAEAPTRLATLGVGYGDGYPRRASGRARVAIAGTERPVVGTICMDMCMVDLGAPEGDLARRVAVGDEAVLFGPDGPTAYDVARWAETIPYEICCGISPRVPRSYRGAVPPKTRPGRAAPPPSARGR